MMCGAQTAARASRDALAACSASAHVSYPPRCTTAAHASREIDSHRVRNAGFLPALRSVTMQLS